MWQLDYPGLLLLLPLPLLGYRWLPAYCEVRVAVRVPFFAAIALALGKAPEASTPRRNLAQLCLNVLVWCLLVSACTRPIWVEKPIERRQPARDILLAIDISQSMETRDFDNIDGQRVDRLSAVKTVVKGFIQRRPDDRLGLVVFGSKAFPQAPLTLDHSSLDVLLNSVGVGMAGPNTAIGDAIGVAVKLLDQAREQEKLLILLTDGNDTASVVTPHAAAALAARHGVVVHTIAIGQPQAKGDARVDLETLRDIARASGGRFIHADDRTALEHAYLSLDRLTPKDVKVLSHQPRHEVFWIPLGGAVGLLMLYHLIALALARVNLRREAQA